LAQHNDALLILVPRHPERFENVYELASQYFKTVKRSEKAPVTNNSQVLLGDTMGELLFLYALADMAFVGGSLVDVGGHNVLEPIALHKPVICGPYLYNFKEITNQLIAEQALLIVNNSQELFLHLKKLIEKPEMIAQMVEGGNHIMQRNRGALAKLLKEIANYLD